MMALLIDTQTKGSLPKISLAILSMDAEKKSLRARAYETFMVILRDIRRKLIDSRQPL